MQETDSLLTLNNLRVQIKSNHEIIQPIDNVNLTVRRGEIFALVGESGCGKTMTALSINRLLPSNAYLCEKSEIFLGNMPLHQYSENAMRQIRGKKIGMIFQDPSLALNPVFTIGEQLQEAITEKKQIKKTMIELLNKVKIQNPEFMIEQYPHQLSGGMKQRIVIAMAIANSPDLIIADEPTTALDVTTQAQILALLKDLNKQLNIGIFLITHDLAIVSQMADTVGVMYAGHIVECATVKEFIDTPRHPYSQLLFASLPDNVPSNKQLVTIPGQVPNLNQNFTLCRFRGRCPFIFKPCEERNPPLTPVNPKSAVRCHWYDQHETALLPKALIMPKLILPERQENELLKPEIEKEEVNPTLQLSNVTVYFPVRRGLLNKTVGIVKAVDGVSLRIDEGQTLALVGESGCGKTTLGKAIVRLTEAKGEILFQNQNLLKLQGSKLRQARSNFQIIFQDPASAMDPRMSVNEIIEEGMIALKIGTDLKERQDRVDVLLHQVGLPYNFKSRFPHELSGGQRQRVAIARALAVGAELIVCDEPTSALDVSVQAQILNLLKSLQNDLGISYLFITHNISVVKYIADFVAVMYLGKIVEYGPTMEILNAPTHPYTQELLRAVPTLSRKVG